VYRGCGGAAVREVSYETNPLILLSIAFAAARLRPAVGDHQHRPDDDVDPSRRSADPELTLTASNSRCGAEVRPERLAAEADMNPYVSQYEATAGTCRRTRWIASSRSPASFKGGMLYRGGGFRVPRAQGWRGGTRTRHYLFKLRQPIADGVVSQNNVTLILRPRLRLQRR